MNVSARVLPAILICGGIVLMQAHAIDFWVEHTGKLGVLWSIMLECAALWLWSQRGIVKNMAAATTTLLVLAGPMYTVSAPALEQYQTSTTAPAINIARKAQLIEQRDQLSQALATFAENSKTRVGWAGRIDATSAQLERVNQQLADLYSTQTQTQPMAWQALAVIAMQACALVIFQLVIVLSIKALTRKPLGQQPSADIGRNNPALVAKRASKQKGKQSKPRANTARQAVAA